MSGVLLWSASTSGNERLHDLEERERFARAFAIYGNPTIRVPQIKDEIRVDCSASEEVWAEAAKTQIAWLASPLRNVPAAEETNVLVFEDGQNLYVFFDARESTPESIRAHFRRRDKIFSDDYVGLGIDTAGDGTRIFEFFANPLGVQGDALAGQVSGEDFAFDATWESSGCLDNDGYRVEFSIPLSELRFSSSGQERPWRMFFTRTYWKDQRFQAFHYPKDPDNACLKCQHPPVDGFRDVGVSRSVELVPSFVSVAQRARHQRGTSLFPHGEGVELGIDDLRWRLSDDVTVNATYKPDFSNIEADNAQSSANASRALFFPERRPFFLEGRDLFRTQVNLVNTRVSGHSEASLPTG